MRDPLKNPRALDVLRWVEFGEIVIATVLDVRGDVVRLSLVYSGQQQHDEALLADWPDWSGLDDVTVLRAADSPVPAAATDPWRPGAHDEERLAVGGALQRVVTTASETPSALSRASTEVPAKLGPAPGAAGMWRPVADYACSGEPTCVFARWLVPVQP